MPDEDKPFITTKNGWSMQIVPRNAAGWRAFALWLVAAGLLTGAYLWITSNEDSLAATAVFVLAMIAWGGAMTRWMYVRSEVIDVRKLAEERRQSRRP